MRIHTSHDMLLLISASLFMFVHILFYRLVETMELLAFNIEELIQIYKSDQLISDEDTLIITALRYFFCR